MNDVTFDSSVDAIRSHVSDRYDKLRLIGAGGMGAVYRAYDKKLNRIVALKVILSGVAAVREVQARFEREVLALAKINHPNIVQLFDFESTGTRAYFTMEYIRGLSLRQLIAQKKIAVPAAVRAFIGLCDALATVHQAGLVHRDIKPSNIIINRQGKAILMDFGLAKFLDNDTLTQLTRTDQVFGTLRYLPPEALLVAASSPSSDVYQLGIMLQETVTSKHPINAKGMTNVIRQIRDGDLPKPKGAGIDAELTAIIEKARATDPSLRYQNAGELRDSLTEWLGEIPEEESSIEIPPEFLRSMTGHSQITSGTRNKLIGYVLAVLVAFIGAAGLHYYKRSHRRRRRRPRPTIAATIAPKEDKKSKVEQDSLGWTPLHHAAFGGQAPLVTMLLKNGEPLDLADDNGWLPIHVAAAEGHLEVVKALLQAGASVDGWTEDGSTPLMWAAASKRTAIVDLLLAKGASVHEEDRYGRQPLHWAAQGGELEVVRKLIEQGASVNASDQGSQTALHIASEEGHKEVVSYLIGKKANVNLVDYRGSTPVYLAAAKGNHSVVEVLIGEPVEVDRVNNLGMSPLLAAIANSDTRMVALLVEKGADAKSPSPFGVTPMWLAEKQAIVDIIKLVEKHGGKSGGQ